VSGEAADFRAEVDSVSRTLSRRIGKLTGRYATLLNPLTAEAVVLAVKGHRRPAKWGASWK